MRWSSDQPASLRRRLAAAVSPEVVALALAIVLTLLIVLVVKPGPLAGRSGDPSTSPSAAPRPSATLPVTGARPVAVLVAVPRRSGLTAPRAASPRSSPGW